jgi:site-specific recombinase XerD
VESGLAIIAIEWSYNLRAKNLSPATIRSYLEAVRLLDEQLGSVDVADVAQRDIEKFVIAPTEKHSTGTVLTRYRALRVFFNWAADEQIVDASPMARMKEPKTDQRPPDVPSDDEVRRLLKSMSGKSFNDRRDLALIRFLIDTGCRIGEVVGLRDVDLDFDAGVAVVFGKGRKARVVPFGNRAAQALLAYRRERRKHRFAGLPEVFLGQRGALTYSAAYKIVRHRAGVVGIELHPHQTRHFFAHSWLRGGGTESDLRAIGGWESNLVMRRYGASAASERAREAHRRLSPGDRL